MKTDQKSSIETRRPRTKVHPYPNSNFLSKWAFCWLRELIWVSKTTPWTQDMNYHLSPQDKVSIHKARLCETFKSKRGIESTLISAYFSEILIFCIGNLILTIMGSLAKSKSSQAAGLINTGTIYQDPDALKQFFVYLGISILLSFMNDSVYGFLDFKLRRGGVNSRAGFYSLLMSKILRFSPLNSSQVNEGFITNLIQVDSVKLGEYIVVISFAISYFLRACVGLYFIVYSIGWKLSMSFMGVMIGVRVIYILLYLLTAKIKAAYMKAKDSRMGLFRNVLENVEYIKINSLEDYFSLELYELRESELRQLRNTAYLESVFHLIAGVLDKCPSLVIIILLVYCFDEQIGYTNYLFYLQLSTSLNHHLTDLFNVSREIVNVKVSLRRIDKFLLSREIDSNNIKRISDEDNQIAIQVLNGNFKWRFTDSEEGLGLDAPRRRRMSTMIVDGPRADSLLTTSRPTTSYSFLSEDMEGSEDENSELNQFYVRGVNLLIFKGEKVVVLGKSCSGRSSLLYSVMGEMIPMSSETKVVVNGSVGHLAQTRWLLGMSIKDNIVLGKEFDQEWIEEALRCSQLVKDMNTFQGGLETLLGDNGDTISGGQRARIALARCFYQE